MNPALAYLTGIGAALLVVVLVSAGWIVHLRAGPPLDGWVAGPMVIALPFVLVVLTAIWLVFRAIAGRWISWRAPAVAVTSGAIGLAISAVACGPVACFTMGPNRALGWFAVLGVASAALVHHVVFRRMRREPANGR